MSDAAFADYGARQFVLRTRELPNVAATWTLRSQSVRSAIKFLSQNLSEKTFFIALWKSDFRSLNDYDSPSPTTAELFRVGKASRMAMRCRTIWSQLFARFWEPLRIFTVPVARMPEFMPWLR